MRYGVFLLILVFIIGCKGDKSASYPSTDLLKHGFSISVRAPADAEIDSDDLGIMQELTIKGGEDYNVQILKSKTATTNAQEAVSGQKTLIKSDRYFSKIIEEYDNGFVFEKDIDGNVNYDFRYVKIIGDQEYVYQTGMMGTYSEEAVREMYKSVE